MYNCCRNNKNIKEGVWPKIIFYLFCIARTSHDEHANENL